MGFMHQQYYRLLIGGLWLVGAAAPGVWGAAPTPDQEEALNGYVERMSVESRVVESAADLPDVPSTQPSRPSLPPAEALEAMFERIGLVETLEQHLADPETERGQAVVRLREAKSPRVRRVETVARLRLDNIHMPRQVRLSLAECVTKALENNYTIRRESYTPAIAAAQLVAAEAAFDATYFANYTSSKQDRPSSSPELTGTSSDARGLQTGIGKLLATGARVSTSYELTRTETDLAFAQLNPAWDNRFIVDFQQPLLRGFGLDANRSQIDLRKLEQEAGQLTFRQQVRDTLRDVEEAYWQLVAARRSITIQVKLLRNTERLLDILDSRSKFDVIAVQIKQAESRRAEQLSRFVGLLDNVRGAQDALRTLLNDPDLPLTDREIEIIPTDSLETEVQVVRHPIPLLRAAHNNRVGRLREEVAGLLASLTEETPSKRKDPEQVNRRIEEIAQEGQSIRTQYRRDVHAVELAEVQSALDYREELRSARLNVSSAKILLGLAKNQALPRFDVTLRYTVNGLGANSDLAFDQLTANDFEDWFVGLEFEWPLGNRGPRAEIRRRRLEESQAVARVQETIEGIYLDVLNATGALETHFAEIEANVEALRANQEQIEAIEARAEDRSPDQVDRELGAYAATANSSRLLLEALARYNVSLIDLERAKGTLLEYNNITLSD